LRVRLIAGHELLVQGPATTRLVSGDVSSLAKRLVIGEPLTVRAGRLRIIEASEDSELDLITGQNGSVDEVEKSTIPPDWSALAEKVTTERATDLRIMVLGGLDTGKNTLITYLSNKLLQAGFKVAIVDADMGQSEIGPPTTMAIAYLKNSIFELLEAEPDSIFFVGSTSPAYVVGRVLKGAEELMNHFDSTRGKGDMIINMPGWISGQGAVQFISQMISKTNTNHLVSLQRENEAEEILKEVASRVELTRLTVSPYAKPRDREERKFLRETSYRKYFVGSKEFTIRYGEIDLSPLFSSQGEEVPLNVRKEVENIVKNRVLYCEEGLFSINAIVMGQIDAKAEILAEPDDEEWDNETEAIERNESSLQKEIRVIPINGLSNVIVALLDKNRQFVSLGILKNLNFQAKRITIGARSKPSELSWVEVGKVKITQQGHEIGYAEIRRVMPRSDNLEV
jgi:polynucleotide 5'-hydroxyl-kinase GRC3/NOL9